MVSVNFRFINCYHLLLWTEVFFGSITQKLCLYNDKICCCCSVAKLCLTLCDPVDCSMPVLPCPPPPQSFTISQSFPKFMSLESMMLPNHQEKEEEKQQKNSCQLHFFFNQSQSSVGGGIKCFFQSHIDNIVGYLFFSPQLRSLLSCKEVAFLGGAYLQGIKGMMLNPLVNTKRISQDLQPSKLLSIQEDKYMGKNINSLLPNITTMLRGCKEYLTD